MSAPAAPAGQGPGQGGTGPTTWCLTTSPENFAATAEHGWTLQGIKSRRGKTAAEIRPGDKVIYYITGHVAFGATVEVTSPCFEDHEPIWSAKPGRGGSASSRAGEDYPWRFEIRPEVIIENPDLWVPAEALYEALTFPKKWPREHWKLAFQGNIRAWPEPDYRVVRAALQDAAGQTAD